MKLKSLFEASYDNQFIIVEVWDQPDTYFCRVSKQDAKKLKNLAPLASLKSDEGLNNIHEANEIFDRSEKIKPDARWDWHNYEWFEYPNKK